MRTATAIPRRVFASRPLAILAGFLLASAAVASDIPIAPPATALQIATGSRLWLEGDSTLHRFSVEAAHPGVEATLAAGDAAADLRARLLAGGLTKLRVTVALASLGSGDTGLDKNMRKALKPEAASAIVFELTSYTAKDGANGDLLVDARGRLAIAGVEKEIALQATCKLTPEGVQVTGSRDLLMSDYGIKPPTMMLGAVKTADKIVVRFDLRLAAPQSAPNPKQ